MEVRQEITGKRDLALSARHRAWGWGVPAVDIDFLLLEYGNDIVALIEYKHEGKTIFHSTHPSFQALIKLGNKAGVCVFVVRYACDFSWWHITALNRYARVHISEPTTMTEKEYVTFLYKLRKLPLPPNLFRDTKA